MHSNKVIEKQQINLVYIIQFNQTIIHRLSSNDKSKKSKTKSMGIVFLDNENVYMLWHNGLLDKLKQTSSIGKKCHVIKSFLKDKNITDLENKSVKFETIITLRKV